MCLLISDLHVTCLVIYYFTNKYVSGSCLKWSNIQCYFDRSGSAVGIVIMMYFQNSPVEIKLAYLGQHNYLFVYDDLDMSVRSSDCRKDTSL